MYITISHPSHSNPNIHIYHPCNWQVLPRYAVYDSYSVVIKTSILQIFTPLLKTIRWGIVPLHCKVQIIASQFSYCNCKVAYHTRNVKQFFSQGKFYSSTYFSPLYPYFIHPLHTIKRNIAYTQNYIAKCKRCFAFLTEKVLSKAGQKPWICLAYLLWSEFQMIIWTLQWMECIIF